MHWVSEPKYGSDCKLFTFLQTFCAASVFLKVGLSFYGPKTATYWRPLKNIAPKS